MDTIEIKAVNITDIETLRNIGRETFNDTFGVSNSAANMKKYLDESFSLEKLTAEITAPASEFYIAWENNKAIGYLKINTESTQTELKEHNSIEIERIYVLKRFHGKKVGQLLYEKALKIALSQGKTSLWLGVWKENPRAIGFYEKNGFIPFDKHIFKLGEDEQTDIMMRKILA